MDFREYRDIIIYYDGKLFINNKVHPYNECTLLKLINANSDYSEADHTKYKVWVHGRMDKFVLNLLKSGVKGWKLNMYSGFHYFITNHFVFASTKLIVTHRPNFVKYIDQFLVYYDLIKDYYKVNCSVARKPINYYAATAMSAAIKAMKQKFNYRDIKSQLADEVKENKRCPSDSSGLLEALLYANKAGIAYSDADTWETFLTDIPSYDASSAYISMMFYSDFPLGQLMPEKPTIQNVQTAYSSGHWFVAELLSEEVVELPYRSFRPYKARSSENYTKFPDGYYHYTVTPWDLKNLMEHFDYNPFTDYRLHLTRLGVTDKLGYLNKLYRDYMFNVYKLKSQVSGIERIRVKDALVGTVGQGHRPVLTSWNFEKRSHWYMDNYLCPQFAQHILAHQRYIICDIIQQLGGMEHVTYVNTDGIKSYSPAFKTAVEQYNQRFSAVLKEQGYTDTKLGLWEDESYDWLVIYRDMCYVGLKKGSFDITDSLSAYPIPGDIRPEEYFADDNIRLQENRVGKLWKDTNKRLKAKEEYEKWLSNGRTYLNE
ncbi:MAG: hypothetical protein IKL07_08015 [Clostridium sp.]|nr:hypothetical protein [Clostridium sp.]